VTREQPPAAAQPIPIEAPPQIAAETPIPVTSDPFAGIEYSAGVVPGGEYAAPPDSPAPATLVPVRAPLPVGGNIRRPVKVRDVAPAYPALARDARVEGTVMLEATIGVDGRVEDARVLRSIALLDAAALDAVRRWEYTPTLLNGTPIAVVMTVTITFRLSH
jgi:protein TonB